MSRKEREQERKLTSLILTGLMLSNGMFFTPVAEGGSYNASGPSSAPGSGLTKTHVESQDVVHPSTQSEGDTVTFSYTGNDYDTNSCILSAAVGSATSFKNRHVVVSAGSGRLPQLYCGYNTQVGGTVENCTVIVNGGNVGSIIGGYCSSGSTSSVRGCVVTIRGDSRGKIRGGRVLAL